MCERWKNSLEAFIEDMGFAPTPTHTIDRINGDLGYFKENCRWATKKEQGRNRIGNFPVTAFGETKLLCEWVEDERCAVGEAAFYDRIRRLDWEPEAAITTPKRPRWAPRRPKRVKHHA